MSPSAKPMSGYQQVKNFDGSSFFSLDRLCTKSANLAYPSVGRTGCSLVGHVKRVDSSIKYKEEDAVP